MLVKNITMQNAIVGSVEYLTLYSSEAITCFTTV